MKTVWLTISNYNYVHMQDPAKEQVFFQESNIYWAPSSNRTELYAQLAKYKFREILSHQIKYVRELQVFFFIRSFVCFFFCFLLHYVVNATIEH